MLAARDQPNVKDRTQVSMLKTTWKQSRSSSAEILVKKVESDVARTHGPRIMQTQGRFLCIDCAK